MSDKAPPADKRFLQLIEAYCNGAITDEDFSELQRRLHEDVTARAFYRRYLNLHSALADHGEGAGTAWIPTSEKLAKTGRRLSFRKVAAISIAAAILLAAAMLVFWWNRGHPEQDPPPMAALEQSTGNVRITSGAGEVQAMGAARGIQSGDTIRTHGAQSSAVLAFADGTRLSLAGGTSLTFSEKGQKSVVVHGGTLLASVAPQKAGKPLLVLTPQDRVEVLGTKFSLKVTDDETEVIVSEGRIRLTRLRDGKSVVVAAGQRAISNPQEIRVAADQPALPDHWSEDFEDGLPRGWTIGKLDNNDLPSGSRGAIQAVRQLSPDGVSYGIATPSFWDKGMFTVHDDTHIHLTFRMQKPNWVNVILLARTTKGNPPAFASNYLHLMPWTDVKARVWYTLTIPIAKFRRLSGAKPKPFEGEVPFQIIIGALEPDRGLTVDRIWAERGGPADVTIKALK